MRRAIALGVRGVLGLLLLCSGVASRRAQAANFTWDGGSLTTNDWTDDVNWNPNTHPANDGTADIFFDGTTRLTPNVDVAYNVHSIAFNITAGAFVNGGMQLTIGAGGVTNNSTNVQTI